MGERGEKGGRERQGECVEGEGSRAGNRVCAHVWKPCTMILFLLKAA